MRETSFTDLPVFWSVLHSDCEIIIQWNNLTSKRHICFTLYLGFQNLYEKECRGFVLDRRIMEITECENSVFLHCAFH